jgi:gas vesicle protein
LLHAVERFAIEKSILNLKTDWHNVFSQVNKVVLKFLKTKTLKFMNLTNDPKYLIGGFIAGAAVGIAVGMLLAPTSGKETRQKIADGTSKLKDNLVGTVNESIEKLKDQFNTKVDQLAKEGKQKVDYTSEKIKV